MSFHEYNILSIAFPIHFLISRRQEVRCLKKTVFSEQKIEQKQGFSLFLFFGKLGNLVKISHDFLLLSITVTWQIKKNRNPIAIGSTYTK